ncbi:MAG: HPF/RaiA family ribosome-associated protein [Candidatus Aenigmatarchaeota archaeon]
MANVEISHTIFPEKLEIQEEIKKFLEKFEGRWKISSFRVVVKTYSQKGRKKYSFHAKVIASDKIFIAKASSWDIPSTISILLKKLEREIGKKLKRERQEKILMSRKILMKSS